MKKQSMVDVSTGEVQTYRWKTAYNAYLYPKKQTTFGPSRAIPDQALTLTEIIARSVRGLYMDAPKVDLYEGKQGDEDRLIREYIPEEGSLDLAQLEQMRNEAITLEREARKRLQQKARKIKEQQEKELRERLNKGAQQQPSEQKQGDEAPKAKGGNEG